MQRRAIVIVAAAAIALAATFVDLEACGDKFVRLGQSSRLKNYYSVHPASILIYQSAKPNAKGVEKFRALLSKAGHSPDFVSHGVNVAAIVAGGKYDIVIANYEDAAAIRAQLASKPGGPDVLPILYKQSKSVIAQVEADYHCALFDNMGPHEILGEVDHAILTRQKGPSASATK
jgi:hypothetical protein